MAKWNLNDIYNFKDTDKLIKELTEKTEEFKKKREQLNSMCDEEFLEALKEKEKIAEISSKLGAYSGLWLSENTTEQKRNAHDSKISEVLTHLGNETIFFGLWFKEIEDKKAEGIISKSGKYKYLLKRMRDFKENTLKENEEKIINLKDMNGIDIVEKIYSMITNKFRFKWKGKEITLEEINQYKQSHNREERVQSYNIILERYNKEGDILGEIYRSLINDWRTENIKLRNYKTPIEVRNKGNDIPEQAVNTLLNTTKKNAKLFQEYFKIKAKILGINEFDRYDIYTPYNETPETAKEYTYETSKKITLETYKEFSEKAYSYAKKIFDDQHVHSEIIPNKRSGAFCSSPLNTISPFILLNHVNKLNDLYTMMHEIGHGIHTIAASEQTLFTFQAPLPLAETASIFGEMLLTQKMLKIGNTEEKKAVLIKMLDGQYASIIRQVFFTDFEIKAHNLIEKGATTEELDNTYLENLKEQFGDIPVDPIFKHEWKYIPHIYYSPFYCYAYSFGNLLVLSLFKMYQELGSEFIEKYFKILSYGGSKAPAEILSEIGIDITTEEFWQKGFEIIKEEIEELKQIGGEEG